MGCLDETWLRSHVACVGQQGGAGVVIFDDKSVFENIAAALYGHSEQPPSKEDVEDACRAALMHEFVRDLPQGYDTLLGGGSGVGLSGGQKQRLSIARAKLRNPTVLVLGMFVFLRILEVSSNSFCRRSDIGLGRDVPYSCL